VRVFDSLIEATGNRSARPTRGRRAAFVARFSTRGTAGGRPRPSIPQSLSLMKRARLALAGAPEDGGPITPSARSSIARFFGTPAGQGRDAVSWRRWGDRPALRREGPFSSKYVNRRRADRSQASWRTLFWALLTAPMSATTT